MALIQCPECGKEVSDRAGACPVCGFPIAAQKNFGKIRIRLGMHNRTGGIQSVEILANNAILWSGNSGQVAEIDLKEKTAITIKYKANLVCYGGTCDATIDPEKGNKYAVSIRDGFMKTVLTFQMVDVIDSE